MESNNYVARAKSFLSGRGASLALQIAPLALLAAGPAHASAITFTPVTGTVTPFCMSCASGGVGLVGSGTANSKSITNGISFFGSGGVAGSFEGTEGLEFSYSGAASGTGPTTVNIAWNFTGSLGLIVGSVEDETYSYTLKLGFNGATPAACATCSGSEGNGDPATGSGTFTSPSGAITSYQAVFDFSFEPFTPSERFTITIPDSSSIDLTSVAVGVPEPGTFLLLIPGLALFGVRALRGRRGDGTE